MTASDLLETPRGAEGNDRNGAGAPLAVRVDDRLVWVNQSTPAIRLADPANGTCLASIRRLLSA
jgi:hypothetical protein